MRTCAFSLLSSCPCYTKQKLRDWYVLKDEMRTWAFSLSIFMSLLYITRNERWQLLRDEMLPEDSETVLSTLRTLFAVPPYLSPQFFSSSLSLFVLVMTHCYWVLLRPPTKVGQSGRVAYIYICYIYIYAVYIYIYIHTYTHIYIYIYTYIYIYALCVMHICYILYCYGSKTPVQAIEAPRRQERPRLFGRFALQLLGTLEVLSDGFRV